MKRFIIAILILTFAFSLVLLTSCEQGQENVKAIQYFIDGQKVDEKPNGNYIFYVKGTDDTIFYQWDYENGQVVDYDSDADYSVYAFSVSKVYNCIADVKNDNELKIGDIIGVKSYYDGKNYGAGVWSIVENSATAKGAQKLQNGLFAEIKPFELDGKTIITVDMFGTRCDLKNADNRYINMAFQNDIDVVEFENKQYLQTDSLIINKDNMTVDGKGAQIQNKYEKGVVNVDLEIRGSKEQLLKDVTVQNLELFCAEETGVGALYNYNGRNQITVYNTDGFTLRNCRIIVPEEGDESRSNTSIWVNGIVKNLTIENNYMFNYCDSGGGGGIWISTSADSYDDPAQNIVVRNNRVIKNSCDEVFAVFIGYFDGVLVENNYFETKDHYATGDDGGNNGVGIGVYDCETHCKNVKFINNEVRLCLKNTAFIFSDAENIEFAGNKVYVNEGLYGTGKTLKLGLNNLFRMVRMDGLTTANCNVVNLNVHDNYFEVNVGKVLGKNYDFSAIELGISSGSFKNNEFLFNCRVDKIITDSAVEFTDNKITINGSLNNNNAPEGNTVIVNK